MKNDLALRPACEEDKTFLFATYKNTMREYIEWAWGWSDDFQRAGFWHHHPIDKFHVIQLRGYDVGGIYVDEAESCNILRMIFLLPEFQGQGIGKLMIAAEIARARDCGKYLALKVIKVNPAKRLYERLGFMVTQEDSATYFMHAV